MKNNKICVSKKTLLWGGIVILILLVGIVVNTTIESLNKNKLVTNSKASEDAAALNSWCYSYLGLNFSVTTSVTILSQKGSFSFCNGGCDLNTGKCIGNSTKIPDLATSPFCGIGKKYCVEGKNYSFLDPVTDRLRISTFSVDCDQSAFNACESGKCASDGGCVPIPTPTVNELNENSITSAPTPTIIEEIKKEDDFEGGGWLKITGEKLNDPTLYNPKFINDEITQSSPELVKELADYKNWYGSNDISGNKLTKFVALRQVRDGISDTNITASCHKGDVNNLFNFQNIDNNHILDQCQNVVFEYFQNFTTNGSPLFLKAVVDTVRKGEPYKPLKRQIITTELKPGRKTSGDYYQFILYTGLVNNSDIIIAPGTTAQDYEKVIRLLYFEEYKGRVR